MVKWKKLNKKMAGALLAVTMLFTVSTTAFAYVDESAEASRTETTQTEQTADQEQTAQTDAATDNTDAEKTGSAFSTPGNGEVKDDITDDSTKEFLTVTTKNNNTFYIVIDRSATSQNVYMLSQIAEQDLADFLDKDSTATVITPQESAASKVVLDEDDSTADNTKDVTSADTEEKASAKTNPGAMAAVLLLALGGVGAYYYFKIYKPKKEAEEDDISEGLETDDLESLPEEEEFAESDDEFEDTDE